MVVFKFVIAIETDYSASQKITTIIISSIIILIIHVIFTFLIQKSLQDGCVHLRADPCRPVEPFEGLGFSDNQRSLDSLEGSEK